MLKISSIKSAEPKKGGDGVGGDGRDQCEIDGSGIDDVEVEVELEVDEVRKKFRNLSKSKNSSKSKKMVRYSDFLTTGAKLAFTKLRQAFLKAPILYHFDPECHIRIEMDASGYAIGGFLIHLTSDDSGQWHPVAFFSCKIILAKTRYKTHDGKLLAIIEVFKIKKHYLEGFLHELLVFTGHNNLHLFIDTKSLSSRQVCWAQELSCYHFRIDYRQGKANGTADTLSQYPKQSAKEEEIIRTENVKILHHL